ncbi:hypothetical protein OMR07_27920, partial [Methylobacterium organophilum]|nr:hypothetical protein [Methylobacterium organophilum]
MPAAPGGPRLLLRRLREAMAEPVSPQARLDRIVVLIAANVVAEVCSVYVLRDDNTLELFATEGLNREAVHQTRMRTDEGLVGLIARTAEPALVVGEHPDGLEDLTGFGGADPVAALHQRVDRRADLLDR